MSATNDLRLLLDERGVEWWKPYDATASKDRWTHWLSSDGELITALEHVDGRVALSMTLTPEQAIAATLRNDGLERTNDGVDELEAENAKLRELVEKMARALGVGSDWCNRDCGEEFGCWGDENGVTGRCAIVDTMEELGWPVVEVDE